MEPHRESTDGSNTSQSSTLLSSYSQVFLVFFLQVQIPCFILSSYATSQVCEAVLLSVVPVQHCCLEEDPPMPTISFPSAVLCVVDSLSLILVGHSKGKTHKTMNEDKFIILRRRMISMQPCSWTNICARRSTSARSETAPHSTQILPNPHYLFNYESVSRRKVANTF